MTLESDYTPKIGDLVCVTWLDVNQASKGWIEREDIEPIALEVESYGKVIKNTFETIVIASNYCKPTDYLSERFNGILTIPLHNITGIHELKMQPKFETTIKIDENF